MTFGKSFEQIDAKDVYALIEAGSSEGINLEFKCKTYGSSDADKKELLKDVSAFANALGGYLIIGADEDKGSISKLVPINEANIDKELQRLENIIRTGIEPTLVGHRMKPVKVNGGCILIIYVPQSFNPPHRVIFKNSNRYFARNSSGVHELGLEELRRMFGEQRSIEQRASAFLGDRFHKLVTEDGVIFVPSQDGLLTLHLVPLPNFGASHRLPIENLKQQHEKLCPIGTLASSCSWNINLEGYCVYRVKDLCPGYTQMFRDGSIEAISASVFKKRDGRRFILSKSFVNYLRSSVSSYVNAIKEVGGSPPILVQISFSATYGLHLGVDQNLMFDPPPPCNRRELHLPAALLSEFNESHDYQELIAEQMHFLWNAFGLERCHLF